MIANIDVDPRNPNRLFVAALGHPYGPNAERGIFRSTDGGETFEKVLYKNEYASGNDVRIDPSEPEHVYAALWQQQQSYIEGGGFGGTTAQNDGGFSSRPTADPRGAADEGSARRVAGQPRDRAEQSEGCTRRSLHGRAVPRRRGAAPARWRRTRWRWRRRRDGSYKTTDGGEHWFLATRIRARERRQRIRIAPAGRIGGGDLPDAHRRSERTRTSSTAARRCSGGRKTAA
jgi:hypothetical protein